MAFDQWINPSSASEDGYDASRSTCSVTALYKLDGGRDDGDGIRTIEGKRWGEKVLLPGMDREWTEDLLEDQYEREIEEARTCIPGLSDVKRPLAVIGGLHLAHSWRLSEGLKFSTQHHDVWQTRRQTQAY